MDSQGCTKPPCGQRRLCSDCTDAQVGLRLCWAHVSESTYIFFFTLSLNRLFRTRVFMMINIFFITFCSFLRKHEIIMHKPYHTSAVCNASLCCMLCYILLIRAILQGKGVGRVCMYIGVYFSLWMALHYENTPIQIYWKFYNQKRRKKFRYKILKFSYFCSKHT